MDPLTHTLTGAAIAKTKLANGHRWGFPILVVGANLPDFDALTYLIGGDTALIWRRGWSHGPIAMVIFPLLLAAFVLWLDRRRSCRQNRRPERFAPMLALATLAVWSHPLLDWLNTYGIRLLMPFDRRWFYGDALYIVDPWVWLVLGGGVYLSRQGLSQKHPGSKRRNLRWGIVSIFAAAVVLLSPPNEGTDSLRVLWVLGLTSVVAARRLGWPKGPTTRVAGAALAIVAVYAGSMAALSGYAARAAQQYLADAGTPSTRLMAGPVPLHPLRRVIVAETSAGYRSGTYDLTRRPRFRFAPDPIVAPSSAAIDQSWQDPNVQGFRGWARFPIARVVPHDRGSTVFLFDLRYADQPTRGFGGAVVELGGSDPPLD
jgi:inner membrane protein